MKTAHPTRPAPTTEVGQKLLAVDDLAVSYGGIKALKGITLEIGRASCRGRV